MFSIIKSCLSDESKTQLARNLKYSKALSDRDPILSWQLIELTHSAPQTGVLTLDLTITYEDYETETTLQGIYRSTLWSTH